MYLPQRRGGKRVVLELGKDRSERVAQFCLSERANIVVLFLANLVLQLPQFARDLFGHDVHAGGEKLTNLDEQAAQFVRHGAIA